MTRATIVALAFLAGLAVGAGGVLWLGTPPQPEPRVVAVTLERMPLDWAKCPPPTTIMEPHARPL